MPSLQAAVIAASLLSLAFAAPVSQRGLSAGFKISQVPNPSFTGRHGPSHYAKAVAKYGFSVSSVTSTVTSVAGGIISAGSDAAIDPTSVEADPLGTGNSIQEYLCDVTIGGNVFQLDLDTGSSDLWVAGSTLKASNVYEPTTSPIAGSWSIKYGDGTTANGDVYSDTVAIGSATVTGQAVERATTAGDSFFNGGCDGLLGLAFKEDNTVKPQKVNTWFDNAVAQGLPAVFAADLTSDGPGSYDFGQVDDTAFSGELVYTNVDDSYALWMFTPDEGEMGIVDTGTTLILISDAGVEQYYAGTGATYDSQQGGYTFDCSDTLPDFSITVGGYKAVVPGSTINFGSVGAGKCYGGIQSVGDLPFAIYGDIFLKTQYVVFDKRNATPQLGFAAKANTR